MVDADVPLDGVVVLAVPLTRRFIERQIVAEGQLLQAAIPHLVGVVNNDLRTDVIPASIPFRQDGADLMLLDVVLIQQTRIIRDDDGLALIRGKTLSSEDFLREPKLPPDAPVRVGVLEDTRAGQDWPVHQVAFGSEIRLVQREAVQTDHLR